MNENKHTPEPWHTAERSGFPFHIDDARGESVAMMLADDDHDEQRGLDNARRIVACVNACAGIPTADLERFGNSVAPIFEMLMEARMQRDELLAALHKIGFEASSYVDCYETAQAAIASVKGYGQPEKSAKTEVPAIVFYPAGSLGEEVAP